MLAPENLFNGLCSDIIYPHFTKQPRIKQVLRQPVIPDQALTMKAYSFLIHFRRICFHALAHLINNVCC